MVLHISTRLKCCKTFQSLFQPLFHNQTYAIDCTLLFEPCERKMGDCLDNVSIFKEKADSYKLPLFIWADLMWTTQQNGNITNRLSKVSEDTQRSGNLWLVRLYQNSFGAQVLL